MSPRDVSDIAEDVENAHPGHEVVKISLLIEKWRRAEVENSELFLSRLKAVCVCTNPLLLQIICHAF